MKFYCMLNQKIFSYAAIFFLCFLYISPVFACQCRDKKLHVKLNMYTLQTVLETYATDGAGIYPKNLNVLQKGAGEQAYWKVFKNPYTNRTGYGLSFGDMADWGKAVVDKTRKLKYIFGLRVRSKEQPEIERIIENHIGLVLYEYKSPTHYRVYGVDGEGNFLMNRGEIFYLSNE